MVAATGTGQNQVIAAFDFKRFFERHQRQVRLLFVAHRREILEQAIATFRAVLRIGDYGELLVGPHVAERFDHLLSVQGGDAKLPASVGPTWAGLLMTSLLWMSFTLRSCCKLSAHFRRILAEDFIGAYCNSRANGWRKCSCGLPGDRFAAEIRLPEALEEKLLCPFHYFGVADPVSLSSDRFWKKGKYDVGELENIYTGAHAAATQRLEAVITALCRYEPDLERVRGIWLLRVG